ncbi:hypothetical protein H6P81_008420 [Aristolochia fimbriata]|uniref:Uncharacterized protein n=1 Tax=Aristolochia fimbriata TaxID=158543 RepID=A0AAV7EHY2_ARIFI|nr:hypothetical protein H6P81_008420 [Aristolochia fimbriata]
MNFVLLTLELFLALLPITGAKDCNNAFPSSNSHTYRYQIATTENATLKAEFLRRYHLNHGDDHQWAALFPRKLLNQAQKEDRRFDWQMLYRKIKNPAAAGHRTLSMLKELSLHDVRLLMSPNSPHSLAQATNLNYLLMLDADNLVWSFRQTAGLSTPGKPYGGWEAPTVELRGHFVGHYLSATAHMWASTHNDDVRKKMSAVLSALDECQQKIGTGYLSAFPSEFFDRFENLHSVWAPYYTIHKILAGLLDQYTLAGDERALKMMQWMVDYFSNRVQNVIQKHSIERHYASLNEETGGMNDVLYRLYTITGNAKHLVLAHLFDKPCFLGYLALKVDSISGFHSNTHIPVVIGAQMRYEVTGDPLYMEIATFFMDTINGSHAYATGGTSSGEFWHDPKRLADTLGTEDEESCTTYNMLKISRNLFRWTKEIAYADYYERALTNGVLSIQRGTDPGIMIYMIPLGKGNSKAKSYHGWGTPYDAFWCCYGTAIESFSKLGDSIYFEEDAKIPGLHIIQYVSSSLNWRSGKVQVTQMVENVTSWDSYLKVQLTFSPTQGVGQQSTLNLRVPGWTHSADGKAILNGEALSLPSPGSSLSVTRSWASDDTLTLQFPITLRTEYLNEERPEYRPLQAILYGPYLLAGFSEGDDDGDLRSGGSAKSPSDWISPIPSSYNSQLISLSQDLDNETLVVTNGDDRRITMEKLPKSGTASALHATFRLFSKDPITNSSSRDEIVGKTVMLEPFDLPGMVVVRDGKSETLAVSSIIENEKSSSFRVVAGLDGKSDTISLVSDSEAGEDNCYVSGVSKYKEPVGPVTCKPHSSDEGFQKGASFTLNEGLREYYPISFKAKGTKRDFLLEPLLNMKDEFYTVYFYINQS